jgi:hypothetical protein
MEKRFLIGLSAVAIMSQSFAPVIAGDGAKAPAYVLSDAEMDAVHAGDVTDAIGLLIGAFEAAGNAIGEAVCGATDCTTPPPPPPPPPPSDSGQEGHGGSQIKVPTPPSNPLQNLPALTNRDPSRFVPPQFSAIGGVQPK